MEIGYLFGINQWDTCMDIEIGFWGSTMDTDGYGLKV